MENPAGEAVDAPDLQGNPVNDLLTALYSHYRCRLPPPDPEHAAEFVRVQKRKREKPQSFGAVLTSPPRWTKEISLFKTKGAAPQGESSLALKVPFLDSGVRLFSHSAAEEAASASPDQLPAPKKSVLKHPLPAFDEARYKENPNWAGRSLAVLKAPVEAVVKARSRAARAGNADRQRPVATEEHLDSECRSPTEYSRSPVGYENNTAGDSHGQQFGSCDSDQQDCSGDRQIRDDEPRFGVHRSNSVERSFSRSERDQRRASDSQSYRSSVYFRSPVEASSDPLNSNKKYRTGRRQTLDNEPRFGIHRSSSAERSANRDQRRAFDSRSHHSSVHSRDSVKVSSNPFNSYEDRSPGDRQIQGKESVIRSPPSSWPERTSSRATGTRSYRSPVYSQGSVKLPFNQFDSYTDYSPGDRQVLENIEAVTTRRSNLALRSSGFSEGTTCKAGGNLSDLSSVYSQKPPESSHGSSRHSTLASLDGPRANVLIGPQSPSQVNMDPSRVSRFLDPASARDSVMTSQKLAAVKIAKEQEKAIHEKLRRNGHDIPKYEFQELIGKGAYGRVFKWYAVSPFFFISSHASINHSILS